MAASPAENAVRNYLAALRDPAAMRDDAKIASLRTKLQASADEVERLQLRQEIIEAQNPSIDALEAAFVSHAKAWATGMSISERAFVEEGVSPQVLRRAGFKVPDGRGRPKGSKNQRTSPRTRVSSDEVRAAIPKGAFTIAQLHEISGASAAVVRKVVKEEEAAGRLVQAGKQKANEGPGRSSLLYKKA